MNSIEVIVWFIFIMTVCLLFFAAFSGDRVSNQTIEEYMDNLMAEETEDWGKRGS
jgi:hypothetical protein